jgi:IS1 family transposase
VNILSPEQQTTIIAALCDGCSIRAVERMTGIHRDTIMRLGARVGTGALKFHDRTMHSLQVAHLQLDETWSYVGKKQRNVKLADSYDFGDQYIHIALASSAKAIVAFRVGKRDSDNTARFVADLRERVVNAPEISTDAWPFYGPAIRDAFGDHCSHGVIRKVFAGDQSRTSAAHRYSPGYVVAVERYAEIGEPENICTSHIERQNLTLRMQQRRFTRLTNGFSKKLENHVASVGLYVAHYNFCRVHEALGRRQTPAMALGLTDHVWTIGELMQACLADREREPRQLPPRGGFRVIEGGRA